MSTYSDLARETESARIIAVENNVLPAYWEAVGDYAAQHDARRIGALDAIRLVRRDTQRAIGKRVAA